MTDHDREEYIPVEEAAALLRVGVRQTHRYGESGRIRTIKLANRNLFHRGDTEKLAEEIGAFNKLNVPKPLPRGEMVPATELLDRLLEAQQQLQQATMTIGALQAKLEDRLLPDQARDLEKRLTIAETERDMLRQQLEQMRAEAEQARLPWYKRLFS